MKRFVLLFTSFVLLLSNVHAQCDNDYPDCSITIIGNDTYGYGWGGAGIYIFQDTILRGFFTVSSGTYAYETFPVCSGRVLLVWSSGPHDAACSFSVSDQNGLELYSCPSAVTDEPGVLLDTIVLLSACSSCLPPYNLECSAGVDSAMVTWWADAGSGFFYQCTTSSSPSVNEWLYTTDTVAHVTGLYPNNLYHFFVQSRCGADDSSIVVSKVFRTGCGAEQDVPIVEGFENDGEMVACWPVWEYTSVSNYGYTVSYPQINYYYHSGIYSLNMYSDYGPNSVMSPLVALPAEEIEVRLWAFGTGCSLQVGYAYTTDSATAVFHPVDTLLLGSDFELYNVSFADVGVRDSVYVVLRTSDNPMYSNLYIDDITIRRRSECPATEGLRVVSTAWGELTLDWGGDSATAWEVAYGAVGFDPDEGGERAIVTMRPGTVRGLANNGLYELYIRSVCSTGYGYWSMPIQAQPNVYLMPATGCDTLRTCGMAVCDPGGVTGFTEFGTVSRLVVMPDNDSLTVSLHGGVNLGTATLDLYEGVGTDGRHIATLTGSGMVEAESFAGAMTLELHAESSTPAGFVLYTECTPLPSCADVYDLTPLEVEATEALVDWRYAGVTTASRFVVTVYDTLRGTELEIVVGDTCRQVLLAGLEEHTVYLVKVNAVCQSGDTSSGCWCSFATPCMTGGTLAIGDEESTATSNYMPFYPYYDNSLSQHIIEAYEMEGVDTVYGVRFRKVSGENCVRNIDVYMDTTQQSDYSTADDMVEQGAESRRFSGVLAMVDGWNEIVFDRPFVYSGEGNVIVTFDDNTGTNDYSTFFAQCHYASGRKSLYVQGASGNVDPADATTVAEQPYYCKDALNSRLNLQLLTPCGDTGCLAPRVSVYGVDTGSVTLSLVAGGNETQWSVEYAEGNSLEWQNAFSVVWPDTVVVSGLMPATAYRFRVGSLCGDTTVYATARATTLCVPVHRVPFTEDFSNFVGGNYDETFQPCWFRYTNYVSYYGDVFYPYVDSYMGEGSMYLYVSPYSNEYSLLALPEMGVPVDTLRVRFDLSGTYTSYFVYRVAVGVMTDPVDPATFVAVDTVQFAGSDYEWESFEVDFAGYSGGGRYIAFRSLCDDILADGVYLDNVRVDYTNPCKRAVGLTVDDVRSGSARFSFVDTNGVGSYTLFYGTADSLSGASDSVHFSTVSFTLTGLAPATVYHAWLRVDCTSQASDVSAFQPFVTHCEPLLIDEASSYEWDFEPGLDGCMFQDLLEGASPWVDTGSYYNPTGAHSGGYVAQLGGPGQWAATRLLLPPFDCSYLQEDAELSLWLAQVASDGINDSLAVLYRTSDTGVWIPVACFADEVPVWTQVFVSLPNAAGQPYYQVALAGFAAGGHGVKVDDISVHAAPSCRRPVGVWVDEVTDSSARIGWSGNSGSYQVHYRAEGEWSWQQAFATEGNVTLTGLRNLTHYEVRVKGYCDGYEQSDWSDVHHFSTLACVVTGFAYNYDSAAFSPAVSHTHPGSPYYAYSYNEVLVDGSRLAGVDDIVAFGFATGNASAGGAFGDCQVYFGTTTDTVLDHFHFDSTFVKVYDGSLGYSAAGWHYFRLDTVFAFGGAGNLVVAINRAGATINGVVDPRFGAHVERGVKCMEMHSLYDAFIPSSARLYPSYYFNYDSVAPDYVFISCAQYCSAPEAVSVAVSDRSAIVNWTGTGSTAEVSYKRADAPDWSTPVAVEGSTYTVTGLDHSTQYLFRVRYDCTADSLGHSLWLTTSATTDYVCNVPADVQVDPLNGRTVVVQWTAPPSDSLWNVRVYNNTFDSVYIVRSNPARIERLNAGVLYHLQVRTLCGPMRNVYGDYSDPVGFTTPICGAASRMHGQADGTTARLAWMGGDNNQYWEITYRPLDAQPGERTDTVISADTLYTIRNLQPNTTYAFRVRALCGLEWNSDWSDPELLLTTGEPTGIDEGGMQPVCTLFPNPASGYVNLSVAGVEGPLAVSIINTSGELLVTESLRCKDGCKTALDISRLGKGVYFVHVAGADTNIVHKLIVQ